MDAPVLGRSALSGRIPVSVVTGFLGSGKTTLVNKLLKRPEMNRVAVIVNELGEQAIDNDLVEVSSEQMMLLNNGCLCCVLRGDLQETLRELFVKRRTGEKRGVAIELRLFAAAGINSPVAMAVSASVLNGVE